MLKKTVKTLMYLIIFFFLSTIFVVIVFKWLPVRYTPLMAIRYFENINEKKYYTQKNWKSINEISPNMVLAVIASEDTRFFDHKGFDWKEIEIALKQNKVKKKKRGASTITQQVAKNVFLLPSRTWIRKGFEAYFTVLIEFFWSKERILEVYLNIIETGKGVFGVEAATQKYFKKPVKKITRYEAALLTAILPSPQTRNPDEPTNYLRKRQQQILKTMAQLGSINFNDDKVK